ncbi:MAG: phosphoesterase [Methanohalophilus sp. T328-1]|uniref:metallophosphoesterase n=1 Tax=Methanohalophilus sp. DAL1 TaxID=1864608 RepID=UPI00079AF278|nr:metallophosphoesterase [Methanohalophilus sp. DAL1]KXS46715.1 MAG: phosphoesterase [Methanohalophilus sp. T328-1]OBZ35693.1 MAG: phosphoesterase [Methanohalophilus sp. DAL1]
MTIDIEPLLDEPALLVKGQSRTLVLSDLHIGIEWDLYKSGFLVPSGLERRLKKIEGYIEQTKPERIVLLGDIKHNVPQISWQERDEIPMFLEKLALHAEIDIFPGNHDGGIEFLLPKNKRIHLHPSRGDIIEEVGYFHGHTWPDPKLITAQHLIVAHNHPTLRITDSLGYSTSEQVWVKTKLNHEKLKNHFEKIGVDMPESDTQPDVVVIPAFNELCGGVAFNEAILDDLLGPAFSSGSIDVANADIYLLDGMYMGKLKDIKKLSITKKRKGKRRKGL